MDKLNFRGHWNVLRGKLKQANAKLTDDDLQYIEGREEELVGRIQQRIGKSREETVRWIQSLDGDNRSSQSGNMGNREGGNSSQDTNRR